MTDFTSLLHQFATERFINANASEAPQFQEPRQHSRPSPLTTSHTTRPIHTQEVAGSSPRAPTIQINSLKLRINPSRVPGERIGVGSWVVRTKGFWPPDDVESTNPGHSLNNLSRLRNAGDQARCGYVFDPP